jgi:hypothetical protein
MSPLRICSAQNSMSMDIFGGAKLTGVHTLA